MSPRRRTPLPLTRYVQPDEAKRIVRLRRQGKTIEAISKATGRSCQAISRTLKSEGVPHTRAVNPSPAMARRCATITALALEGKSADEIARTLDLDRCAVSNAVARQRLFHATGLIPPGELARELGITVSALILAVKDGRLSASKWMLQRVFNPQQVEAARALYAKHRSLTDLDGYLTQEQAARELGLSIHRFVHLLQANDPRVQGVKGIPVSGQSGRPVRYDPLAVRQAAARNGRPLPKDYHKAGLVQTDVVAGMVCRSEAALRNWTSLHGCPHQKDHSARLWFDLPAVATWLESMPHISYQRAAVSLRRALEKKTEQAA